MWSKKDMVEHCEKIGGQIGLYCGEVERGTLLYDLRRCKRFDKFLEILDRIKHKVDGYKIPIGEKQIPLHIDIKKEFFEYLAKYRTEWREYKALISIFAKDKEYDVIRAKEYSKMKEE